VHSVKYYALIIDLNKPVLVLRSYVLRILLLIENENVIMDSKQSHILTSAASIMMRAPHSLAVRTISRALLMLPLLLSVTTTVLPLPFKCLSSMLLSLLTSASCRVGTGGTAGGTVEVEVGVSPSVEVTVT
jgi:hypothetical protein